MLCATARQKKKCDAATDAFSQALNQPPKKNKKK
jgi:hypothetical protein